jgi:hypothetical protein
MTPSASIEPSPHSPPPTLRPSKEACQSRDPATSFEAFKNVIQGLPRRQYITTYEDAPPPTKPKLIAPFDIVLKEGLELSLEQIELFRQDKKDGPPESVMNEVSLYTVQEGLVSFDWDC